MYILLLQAKNIIFNVKFLNYDFIFSKISSRENMTSILSIPVPMST